MGIQNLLKLIKECAPDAIISKNLTGMTVAIDASIWIYQWHTTGVTRTIKNTTGKHINHLQGALFRTTAILTAGVKPVYVFDGRAPKAKAAILLKRREIRARTETKSIPREVYAETAEVIRLMGVATIQAPSEAEAQAAAMQIAGQVDAVASEDLDVLAFGARYLVMGIDTKINNGAYTVIDRNLVLSTFKLNSTQFVDLCILLGCDYTGKLPGIGYKKSLALMQKHGSIENIISALGLHDIRGFDFHTARREFLFPQVDTNLPITAPARDIVGLKSYLLGQQLEPRRIDGTLKKLEKI